MNDDCAVFSYVGFGRKVGYPGQTNLINYSPRLPRQAAERRIRITVF